jgi:cation/acetate symporter
MYPIPLRLILKEASVTRVMTRVLLALVPAIAVFSKLALLTAIAQPAPVSSLPQWVYDLGQLHALKICGVEPGSADAVTAACAGLSGHKGLLRLQDVRLDADLAFLAAPRIGGVASFLSGLAAAGLGAALLAMCAGAAFAGGEAVARGLVAIPADREQSGRAAISRFAGVGLVAVAALAALSGTRETIALAEWILPLSSVALFVPLMLALCWRRASSAGVIAGMIAGGAATLYYLVATRYWPVAFVDAWSALSNAAPSALRKLEQLRSLSDSAGPENKAAAYGALETHARSLASWLGIRAPAAGLIGVPAGLAAGIVVSLLTPRRKAAVEAPAAAGGEGS